MENLGLPSEPELGRNQAGENSESEERKRELSFALWKDLPGLKSILESVKPQQESLNKILESLKPPAEACKPKPSDWTIAINYTTDFGNGQGVDSGYKMLSDFAAKTKGKGVTIVAQMAIAEKKEEGCEEECLPELFAEEGASKYRLDRYVIRDGQMTKVSSKESKGYGDDLKDLLAYSSSMHPGKRMGLIIDSHGMGNEGLMGDTGEITVKDFVCKVKEGLKGGREKLDMLEFDTCLMGANGAISKIKDVSDNIIASAETEGIYNGQNYMAGIERLLEKPETDGFALAREILVRTHKDMEILKANGKDPPVDTLSHFNMKNYNEFRKSLDEFGNALCKAVDDPENKELIEAAIDSTRKYGSSGGGILAVLFGGGPGERHRTDLKEFTEKILLAVDNGELKDPDRVLKNAAQEVMSKRGALVDSYHGMGDYLKNGGLSVFLPARSLRNLDKEAKLATSAGRLCQLTEPKRFSLVNKSDETRSEFVKKLNQEIEATKPHMLILGVKGVENQTSALEKLSDEFKKAEGDEGRQQCFQKLQDASLALFNSEEVQTQFKKELSARQEKASKVFKANMLEASSDGWTKFRNKLRDGK